MPPSGVTIEGYTDGGVVRVPRGEENVALTCVSPYGKPAATLTWRRNDVDITDGIVASIEDIPGSKLQVTNISLYPCYANKLSVPFGVLV